MDRTGAARMDVEKIVAWYRAPRKASIPASKALELYFQFHPRTAFLKTLPARAVVADIGVSLGCGAWQRTSRRARGRTVAGQSVAQPGGV